MGLTIQVLEGWSSWEDRMRAWIGRQSKVKNLGETFRISCPMCCSEEFWHLWKIEEQVLVWGRPWLRYPREHWLVCPICLGRLPVVPGALSETKRIACLHRNYLAGGLPEKEYQAGLRQKYVPAFESVLQSLEPWTDQVQAATQGLRKKVDTTRAVTGHIRSCRGWG